jgi:hypothetical protein
MLGQMVGRGIDMLSDLYTRLQRIWRNAGSSPTVRLSGLKAVEQTKLTWAKPIKSYAGVPEAFKEFFADFQATGQAFPYTVFTPSYQLSLHRTTEKLICDCGTEIYILERSGSSFIAQCFPLEGISYVEVCSILLAFYIQINGVTDNGLVAASSLSCNSISDYLFTPILEKIRFAAIGSKQVVHSSECDKFDVWGRSSHKFMSYAKRSLLGGEKVVQALLQPEFRVSRQAILGKTVYWGISPALVCILTDHELIVIREVERKREEDKYGGIWDYIPLAKIVSLSLREGDRHNLVLSIQLPDRVCLEFLFQASLKPEIGQLLDRFRELTA